ncbi:MAG: alpha/beta hydrolase [Syntrophales bacterium]|nr:alpha/beta hydrolase [Syntrophales bacterium]
MPFFVTEDQIKLYYEDHGRGKPVVLIHGLTASHRHFCKQIDTLQQKYRVVSYDLRGHGDSDCPRDGLTLPRLARDLRELMDHLGLEEVTLVGWSMGAHVIFEYIKQFANGGLHKIVVIDMAPKLVKDDDWTCGLRGINGKFGDFTWRDNALVLSVMSADWDGYCRLLVPRLFNRSHTLPGVDIFQDPAFPWRGDLPWVLEAARQNTPYAVIFFWISMVMQDYRPQLGEIKVPCLITWGRESNYYGEDNYRYMEKAMVKAPVVTVVPFEGCGHALHIQDAGRFNRLLMDFIG